MISNWSLPTSLGSVYSTAKTVLWLCESQVMKASYVKTTENCYSGVHCIDSTTNISS